MWTYILILVVLIVTELVYFKVAERFNIIDKPNQRSSHSTIVLRGGGIIFTISVLIWAIAKGFAGFVEFENYGDSCYPWFVFAVVLAAGISFVDDIHSLPDSLRLFVQFIAMMLMFNQLNFLHLELWWVVIIALIVCVGATNIYNFMDGINGITGGYSLAVIIPLLLLNGNSENKEISIRGGFIDQSFLIVVFLSLLVFCFFNFRQRGKAKCFAGDVGSIGMAFIVLFSIGKLVMSTFDITWLIFIVVYGVDGGLTIIHRIMLHENIGQPHRKHAFQLMANELKLSHPVVSGIYMAIQFVISMGMIYLVPDTILAHWIYLLSVVLVLVIAYVLFMKKYYHLHEEYLASLKK